mgnify:CR=1 FL=1
MKDELQISVIVPVWNGEKEIRLLLDALSEQTSPRGSFEIIVVDNGSTDETVSIVERYPFVRLTREGKPGSYAARNHAIRLARGRFLLFTDADCIPAKDWVEKALHYAETFGEKCLIGGMVKMFRTDNAGPFTSRYDALVTGLNQEWNLKNRLCVTANWLISRSLIEKIGLFNDTLLSGGDGECAGRIADAGYPLHYAPEMIVRHPARASLGALVRKKRRVIGGRWQKSKEKSLSSFSKSNLDEYVTQAKWAKNSGIDTAYKPGVILLIILIWLVVQLEIARLRAGGSPYRA